MDDGCATGAGERQSEQEARDRAASKTIGRVGVHGIIHVGKKVGVIERSE